MEERQKAEDPQMGRAAAAMPPSLEQEKDSEALSQWKDYMKNFTAIIRESAGPERQSYRSLAGPRNEDKPCFAYYRGECKDDNCKKRHPPQGHIRKDIKIKGSIPCKFGKYCKNIGCLFLHRSTQTRRHGDEPRKDKLGGHR
mmetsp:Transcript_36495/g.77630  ORF Transcript_36495/g.77630 Transcript_36495/m.77630 type:complete len:142 (-) Transcript_36495:221-646(-)